MEDVEQDEVVEHYGERLKQQEEDVVNANHFLNIYFLSIFVYVHCAQFIIHDVIN